MIIPTLKLEEKLWTKGFTNVAGVDEVGRGPLAGPVLAGAVMIHKKEQVVNGVRDSKLMSARQREKVFSDICKKSTSFGIGIISESEIDRIGISKAVKTAMLMALLSLENKLGEKISYALVDGSKTLPLEGYKSERIKKGGLYHYSIAAASIIAKVTRDKIMKDLAKIYPNYLFEKNVGYGTKTHYKALEKYGPCKIHRTSFI